MPRLHLFAALLLVGVVFEPRGSAQADPAPGPASLTLPGSAVPGPVNEAVLFGFDDHAFPFRNHVETNLFNPQSSQMVLAPGPVDSYDGAILYYGTVIRINGTYHLWYNGNYGAERPLLGFELAQCAICYATSSDGKHWVKPNLGLVEFNGSRQNNLVDFPDPNLWSTCAMIYEADEAKADRRYKMAYEAHFGKALKFCVAFSPDGLHWHLSPSNLQPIFLEMSGVTKWGGLYYVTGQATLTAHHRTIARRLCSYVSADFEHWSPCSADGLDRSPDTTGPSTADQLGQYEEVHLGAGLWNRGNVLLGIYGQWHGDHSGDRHFLTMDLGLVLSHDALHYQEPIPNFRFIPAREQPGAPIGEGPTLMQGQGMENVGQETLYWYSLWRGRQGSGVRVAIWPRDRLGDLAPFAADHPEAISCLIQAASDPARAYVNVSGLGPNCTLRVSLTDEGFRPLAGFSGEAAAVVTHDGFRVPLRWQGRDRLPAGRRWRLDVHFDGMRPEDAKLYAAYVTTGPE